MDERLHEIEVHKLVLKAQLKAAEDERTGVNKGLSSPLPLGSHC
jgi:hypothetical protein